jgi:hypothetical protein
MGGGALLVLALLFLLGGKKSDGKAKSTDQGKGAAPAGTEPHPEVPGVATSPWPVDSATGAIPPFDLTHWEYDNPPPLEVQLVATKLLPTLWAQGEGATHQERDSTGAALTYRAEWHDAAKTVKGITAYRLKAEHPALAAHA